MYWEGFMQCCEWVWLNTLYQEAVNNYIIPFPYDSSAIELITPTLKSDSIKMPQLEASTAGEFYTYLFWEQVFEPPNAMCRTGPVVSVATQECITLNPKQNKHVSSSSFTIYKCFESPKSSLWATIYPQFFDKGKAKLKLQVISAPHQPVTIHSWLQWETNKEEIKSDSFPRWILRQIKDRLVSTRGWGGCWWNVTSVFSSMTAVLPPRWIWAPLHFQSSPVQIYIC